MQLNRVHCALILSASAVCSLPAAQAQPLSEEALLEYATSPFDAMTGDEGAFVIGSIGGVDITVDWMCSDLCPTYMVRIINIHVPEGQSCEGLGGLEHSMTVPVSIAATERTFCFPRAIVEHWDEYVRRSRVPPIYWDVETMRLQQACRHREGQVIRLDDRVVTCPEHHAVYVSFSDLILRPLAVGAKLVTVVGYMDTRDGLPVLYMSGEHAESEDDEWTAYLVPGASLLAAETCHHRFVRVTGEFNGSRPAVVTVGSILVSDGRLPSRCWDSSPQ